MKGRRPNRPDEDLRSVMRAWGRHQIAAGAETAGIFADMAITTGQMRALGQLRRWGRMIGRELAGHLGVTPATVVPLIDRLEEEGYLRRVPDQTDRRLTWLELTPAADELFRRLSVAGANRVMGAITHLTPEDRRTFERILNQVADHLEKHQLARIKASRQSQGAGRGPGI